MATVPERGVAWVLLVSRPKWCVAIGPLDGQFVERAEAGVVEVVIRFGHEAFIGKLRLKVRGIRGAVADFEGAEERAPVGAVGMDRPESPQMMATQPLGFERAEHDAAILE